MRNQPKKDFFNHVEEACEKLAFVSMAVFTLSLFTIVAVAVIGLIAGLIPGAVGVGIIHAAAVVMFYSILSTLLFAAMAGF